MSVTASVARFIQLACAATLLVCAACDGDTSTDDSGGPGGAASALGGSGPAAGVSGAMAGRGGGATSTGGTLAAGGTSGASGGAPAATGGTPAATGGTVSGYPPGPYGAGDPVEGDVIENLTFMGFPASSGGLATDNDFQTITLADVRASGADYLLLLVATMWCPSCQSAAMDLGDLGQSVLDAGGVIIELVNESTYDNVPTEQELATWVKLYDLPVTTVVPGADGRASAVFPTREWGYIIDLETMEVVWAKRFYFTSQTVAAAGINELLLNYL